MERWLSNEEPWLLFQKAWIQFPAPTWWPTSICNSVVMCSNATFWPLKELHTQGTQTHL